MMAKISSPIDIRERKPIELDQMMVPTWALPDIQEVLISEGELSSRVQKMSFDIYNFYKHGNLYVLTVLKGAVRFFTDLMYNQQMSIPFFHNFVPSSSYAQGTTSSGNPDVILLPYTEEEVRDKDVLVVEDIIDTGLTLEKIVKKIECYSPKSVQIAALLDKPERRKVQDMQAKFTGFTIPDKFVVGYGLDYEGRYRNIPHIGVLKPHVYSKLS
jgi:hypoxanthine phosphoribosyltransferase